MRIFVCQRSKSIDLTRPFMEMFTLLGISTQPQPLSPFLQTELADTLGVQGESAEIPQTSTLRVTDSFDCRGITLEYLSQDGLKWLV